MRVRFGWILGIGVALAMVSDQAQGQWVYPGGYGRYGWRGWGTMPIDPAAGYMAGVGAYARGVGAYELLDAQAQSINADTIIKWNKALRERQREIQRQMREAQARQLARDAAAGQEYRLQSGELLNNLLDRIYEFNPSGSKMYMARVPISPAAIRDIPFEPATEAISFSLDQMTAVDAWPGMLQDDRYADQRAEVRKAVKAALEEDVKGNVSSKTVQKLNDAITKLRDKYKKDRDELDPEVVTTDQFVKSLAGLSRMLHNPQLKKALAELENYKGGTVGDLIAFMQNFNLRFGPATTDRQMEIYRSLAPMLTQVLNDTAGPAAQRDADLDRDTTGKPLHSAAKDVFKDMNWKHFED
jgi:hypothetical protein